jgi:chorismate mutase
VGISRPRRAPARAGSLLAALLGGLLVLTTGCTAKPIADQPTAVAQSSVVPQPSATTSDAAAVARADAIVSAVASRLAVMPQVAAAKREQDLPVRDRQREREVAAAFVATTTAAGVPRALARTVIDD